MSFLSQPITIQSLFGKNRSYGPITFQVVVNESASDILTITKQPVQTGASITDHAYKEPTTFSMQVLFQDNLTISLSEIYKDLLKLQIDRAPFDLVTPKRTYENMLLASIGQTTDKHTENILSVSLSFQQVIFVSVATTDQVPRNRQKNAAATGATQPGGKKSALLTGREAITQVGQFFGGLF